MPELPEVETVRRVLESQIINKKIHDINVYYDKLIDNVLPNEFINKLKGETFQKINRIGKYLIFILDNVSFVTHLRMEGKFYIKEKSAPLEKHEHIEFVFDDGIVLRYHDTRKFGRFYLVTSTKMDDILALKELSKLGPDGNSDNINYAKLYNKMMMSKVPIKTLLLDQTFIAGIGNIYADEILFKVGLHPLTNASRLSISDLREIVKATKEILDQAIEDGGTTIRSYTSSLGVSGRFQQHLNVHTLEECAKCHSKIKKITVGGRGTYFCPKCQKMKYPYKVFGVTGGIAVGKTTLTNLLKDKGYNVIDCDEINRELLDENNPQSKGLFKEIQKIYPDAFVDNTLDKRKLRDKIFEDELIKKQMEQLIHPLVIDEVMNRLNKIDYNKKKNKVVFISAPLLVESDLVILCDKVINIELSNDVWLNRLTSRDQMTKEEALMLISQDINKARKKEMTRLNIPVIVVNNDLGIDDLDKQLIDLLREVQDEI